jgi:hypothetical protein
MQRHTLWFAALALCVTAEAQVSPKPLPPTPDAKAYPQLAAMKSWLEAGSPQARQCALTGGLYLDADRHYRANRSESETIEAVMRPNADKLTGDQRERLRGIVTNVATMAAALVDLAPDSAAIAFSQMCIGRAQRPGYAPAPGTIRAQFSLALQCEREHSAGSLERKECVAAAFRAP